MLPCMMNRSSTHNMEPKFRVLPDLVVIFVFAAPSGKTDQHACECVLRRKSSCANHNNIIIQNVRMFHLQMTRGLGHVQALNQGANQTTLNGISRRFAWFLALRPQPPPPPPCQSTGSTGL